MKLFLKFLPLMLWLLSACTPRTLATNNVSQENLPTVASTLQPKQDYLFYRDWDPEGNEIWAINPESDEKILITKGSLQPGGWSPFGNYWLFQDSDSLYIADVDGANLRRIYNFPKTDNCGELVSWLSNRILLIDIYACDTRGRLLPPPHQYYFDITNGTEGRIDPVQEFDETGTFLIQGIIHKEEKWIQLNWYTGELEIADLRGNRELILSKMDLHTDALSFGMEFVPNTKNVVFHAGHEVEGNAGEKIHGLWIMSTEMQVPELVVESFPDLQIRAFHVSPNGKYLAYAYDNEKLYNIAFYNLQSEKLEHVWNFPYRLSNPRFLWSPDSRFIAFPYSSDTIHEGIQIMDILNGQTRLLIDKDVWMSGWYYVGN